VSGTPNPQDGCAQNWEAAAPVLTIGQRVEADNVVCRSERHGIVCTIASGVHRGMGFQINESTVSRLT
jgi:hypothetical protein